MPVELIPAKPEHIGELGRICYEAFKDITEKHGFRPPFPSAAVARQVVGMMVHREEFYGVAASLDGAPVGSNFLSLLDEVAGVGPITVEVPHQGQAIGRALMQDVIDYARRNNIAQVRLFQEGFNMTSLSLYASLGFDVRDAAALMQPASAAELDSSVRAAVESDLEAAGQLSQRFYKVRRRNELALTIELGFGTLVRERAGRIVGYFTPGLFGHGVAETEDDALALVGEAARLRPPEAALFFCPLSEPSLYRRFLKNGCRTLEVMNMMTLGPYEPPDAVWMPSVLY
jgi:GNAT superfamily N-acetyltransferase